MIDFNQFWKKINALDQSDIGLVALIMRNIWMRRNDYVFNNVFKAPLRVVQSTKLDLEELLIAAGQQNPLPTLAKVRPTRAKVKWVPLVSGAIKVNWDDSVRAKEQRMGIGTVARDSNGLVLACFSSSSLFYLSPLIDECWAL